MTCENIRENLLAHLYEALDDDEERAVAEHLETCSACRAALTNAERECALLSGATRLPADGLRFEPPPRRRVRVITRPRLAAAAVLLAVVSLFAWRAVLRAPILREHPRLVVTGPATFTADQQPRFRVRTETIEGEKLPATIEAAVTGEGGVLHHLTAEADGDMSFEFPEELGRTGEILRVDVRAKVADEVVRAAKVFCREAGGLRAFVGTDKPLYRPGEPIRARAVVLSSFRLEPAANSPVKLALVGPRGEDIAEAPLQTENGVAAWQFDLPGNAPGGEYRLEARTPDGSFATVSRTVAVRAYRPPRLTTDLELDRDSYRPGEAGRLMLSVVRAEGGIPAGATVTATVSVDGVDTATTEHTLAVDGTLAIDFRLPEKVRDGRARIQLTIRDGGTTESAVKTIPVILDRIDAHLYPEGGDLVAGTVNRVYFSVRQPNGDAADLTAEVVDGTGRTVANARVDTLGMGTFEIVPRAGETYRLRADGLTIEGDGVTAKLDGVALGFLDEVAPANGPLRFNLNSTESGEYTVVAFCRDVLVAKEKVELIAGRTKRLELHPDADVGGVFRVTVLDPDGNPRAERLVSRVPARRIGIEIRPEKATSAPGEKVNLTVTTTDEHGTPVPAVLGLSAADDAVLALANDEDTAPLPMHFLLGLEVEELEKVELFAEGDDAARAVDLLLGVQGWRRFAWQDPKAFLAAHASEGPRVVGVRPGRPATVTADNLESAEVAAEYDLNEVDQRAGSVGRGLLALLGLALFLTALVRRANHLSGFRPLTGLAIACGLAILVLLPPTEETPQPASDLILIDVDGGEFDGVTLDESINLDFSDFTVADSAWALNFGSVIVGYSHPLYPLANAVTSEVEPIMLRLLSPGGTDRSDIGSWTFWWNYNREQVLALNRQLLRTPGYYPAWVYTREYAHQHIGGDDGARTDFTDVLYWNPMLVTGSNGTAAVSFETADAITSYRISAEAHSAQGGLGADSAVIQNRLPFWLEPKLPAALTAGDRLLLPVVCANDTSRRETMSVELAGSPPQSIDVAPGERIRVLFDLTAKEGELQVDLTGGSPEGRADRTVRTVPVAPRGYPVAVAESGSLESRAEFDVLLPAEVDRATVAGSLRLYPSIVATLTDGIEGMLRTPGGCFEQVSSTTYPNALVLSCLTETGSASPAIARRAKALLADGYARLIAYECEGGGFDWFGGEAGHEALTAYGLMEFTEMAKFIDVDAEMLDRTRAWLLSRRDGEGGFRSDARRHTFGNAPAEISGAYIVFALTEAGADADLSRELDRLESRARRSEDPYLLALSTLALGNAGRPAAKELAGKLAKFVEEDGSLPGRSTSITASRGRNLTVETTALSAMAFRRNGLTVEANRSMLFLARARRGGGEFGATQATILALRALTEHARLAPDTAARDLTVLVNDRPVAERQVQKGAVGVVTVGDELLAALVPGGNRIEIVSTAEGPLPFTMDLRYRTSVPASDPSCAVRVATKLARTEVVEGGSIDLTVTLTNREAAEVPMTVVRVGLPAGVVPRTGRLDMLKQAGEIAFYEVRPNEVTLYLPGLGAAETREIVFDLTGDFPGHFTGPATSAYLYYDDDAKDWAAPLAIRIDPAK